MKLISWNVNGLRACLTKGFMDSFQTLDADIFCLQETKLQEGQHDLDLPGYHQYWNYAEKKGYSGTAIFTKEKPMSVQYGLGIEQHDHEGRVITLEFPEYYFITVYVPNSQDELRRLDYRMIWEDDFLSFVKRLGENKPVIYCGDLNVAHREIDLKNPFAKLGSSVQALEYYNGFSLYGFKESGAYEFSFYAREEGEKKVSYDYDDSRLTIAQWAGNAHYDEVESAKEYIYGDIYETNDMLDKTAIYTVVVNGKNTQPWTSATSSTTGSTSFYMGFCDIYSL